MGDFTRQNSGFKLEPCSAWQIFFYKSSILISTPFLRGICDEGEFS